MFSPPFGISIPLEELQQMYSSGESSVPSRFHGVCSMNINFPAKNEAEELKN